MKSFRCIFGSRKQNIIVSIMAKKRIAKRLLRQVNPLMDKVQRLLRRNYEPTLTIQQSKIRNADVGCFTTRHVSKGEVRAISLLSQLQRIDSNLDNAETYRLFSSFTEPIAAMFISWCV
jgi:hypothetical protein